MYWEYFANMIDFSRLEKTNYFFWCDWPSFPDFFYFVGSYILNIFYHDLVFHKLPFEWFYSDVYFEYSLPLKIFFDFLTSMNSFYFITILPFSFLYFVQTQLQSHSHKLNSMGSCSCSGFYFPSLSFFILSRSNFEYLLFLWSF